MFPQLRERFGSALDLVVEFSTLGEYRLGADGAVWPASALAPVPERAPQLGGAGDHPLAAQAAVRRIVAGGAAGKVPVATPAARRLAEASQRPARRSADAAATPARRSADAAATPARRSADASGSQARHPAAARPASACLGERRRRVSEQPARGPKPHPGAPTAAEQLCLAV
ncbi:MAG TPA: hypothetical protein VFY52_05810 [Thermoleophilaceae bacterium]|nr:hypothetical protein [Thermoleophilaceae bacterium]